ncbi:MAG: hypothetical protein R2798_03480 [Chitinophagales bacterium]
MKDIIKQHFASLALLFAIILMGTDTAFAQWDDVYYTPDYSTTETYTDASGDTYVTNNNYYYDEDDDYEYYYSSRIRRFHRSYAGFSYWNPCYVDYYWYDYDPFYWGTTIYFTPVWAYRPYRRHFHNSWGWYGPNVVVSYNPWWGVNSWYNSLAVLCT